MWYCTVCGKRNISDEKRLVCDKCVAETKESGAKGTETPALYCHSCGQKNKGESGDIVLDRGEIKQLSHKIDTLIHSIDKLQHVLPEEKAVFPDRDLESNRHKNIIREPELVKEAPRSGPTTEEIRENMARNPCPECNPDGNNSHKGKCKYCDGAGWWPCRRCGGEGVIRDSVLGVFTDDLPTCPKCHGGKWFGCGLCDSPATDLGNSKIRPGNGLCRTCHGLGYV